MKLMIEDIAQMGLEQLHKGRLKRTLESNVTIVAPIGSSAADIARLRDQQPGGVIVVVSAKRKPIGILDPRQFLEDLPQKHVKTSALLDAVLGLEKLSTASRNKLLRGIVANYARRPLPAIWCEAGEHFGDGNPCTAHTTF